MRASSALPRAVSPLVLVVASAFLAAGSGSCAADPEAEPGASPCVAFAKAPATALKVEAVPGSVRASLVRIAEGAGRTYALDRDGNFGRLDAAAGATVPVKGVDFAVTKTGAGVVRAFIARWPSQTDGTTTLELVRLTSSDGGSTFDGATEKVLLSVPRGRTMTGEATSMAFGPDGLLYLAIGDADPAAGAPPTLLGKILRLDVSGDAIAIPPGNPYAGAGGMPEVWAAPVHEPRGLDVDAETGDVWVSDYSTKESATLVHRINGGRTEELKPILTVTAPDKRVAFSGGHVHRGKLVPALVGQYVYSASGGALVAVDRFGPSGTAQSTRLAIGAEGPMGRDEAGELVLAPVTGGLSRVVDAGPPAPVPTSLLATKCFDLGAPAGVVAGAVGYDVTTPLWSDGAVKDRFVVVPQGTKITARPDGDLVFPVGTVAVKTFAVDGKRVETRLLVQHGVEDWVGYSYAWNQAGTDAELVAGNRTVMLPGNKSWYFPSPADCSACHTPAAGYTLGLEAKQLVDRGEALGKLEEKLATPIDHASLARLVPVDAPPPATAEARARSYLHANCSICHREGSATGDVVDLDLRNDTPLAKTGLCREPQAGSLGIANARIVAPHEPARSVIVARMRAVDDRRMPKLASRVVDEAGVAAVEAWIKDLAACP